MTQLSSQLHWPAWSLQLWSSELSSSVGCARLLLQVYWPVQLIFCSTLLYLFKKRYLSNTFWLLHLVSILAAPSYVTSWMTWLFLHVASPYHLSLTPTGPLCYCSSLSLGLIVCSSLHQYPHLLALNEICNSKISCWYSSWSLSPLRPNPSAALHWVSRH